MKQEANAKMSQKPMKRKRETPETPRKKPRVAEVKAEEDSGERAMIIQVKKETAG